MRWDCLFGGLLIVAGCGDDSSAADPSSTSGGPAGSSSGPGTSTSASTGEESSSDASTTTTTTTGADPGTDESSTGEPEDTDFQAGFDVTSISPNEGQLALNIFMGSYGAPYARGAAESVHDDIYIRSFAVGLGENGFVAAVADLPGMGNDFTQVIRQRVADNTGLAPERVLIGTTHSHSAPDFQGLWGGGPSEYRGPVIDEIVGSMSRAWLLREPSTLEVTSTTAPNRNRRDWEFTDDSLTVLLARDTDGELMGTFGVFAAHPTVLGESNNAISRDWCGGYVDTMEDHTGAPSVLFNGVLGDASTAVPDGEYADDFERAFAYGALIADLAFEATSDTDLIDTELVFDHADWLLPVDNALFQLAAAVGLLDYSFAESEGGQMVDTRGAYIRLGTQLQLVTFPGEALTRTGLEIKDAMTTPHRAVLGQTGESLGYFILGDEWMTGRNDDYEETIALHESAGDVAVEHLRGLVEADRF